MTRRVALGLLGVLLPSSAYAQLLRDPVPAETIPDGVSLAASGSVLGETGPSSDSQVDGELAAVISWTRAGVDRTEGFRGPRFTNRWGAALALRSAIGSNHRPLDLEERSEVALYLGSVGQTVAWQSRPRMTDTFWHRASDRLSLGVFGDFAGLGVIKEDHGDDLSCEGFPMYVELTRDFTDVPSTTTQFEIAVARVVGRPGDLRIFNDRLSLRQVGALRAVALDSELLSARHVELSPHSSWSMSGAIGTSLLEPFEPEGHSILDNPNSIIPLARIGIEHRGTTQIHSSRSEIGRPLLDGADFGVELSTMHRLVEEAGLDAGGQLTAWSSHPLSDQVSVHAEGMFGAASRRMRPEMATGTDAPTWVDARGLVLIARGELGLTAKLAHGFGLETRAWVEHSERDQPTAPARWQAGLLAGLAWHL